MGSPRREVLKGLGAGALAMGLSRPALAQSDPTIAWKLASSFVPTLDLIYGGADTFAATVAELTGGKFTIQVSPAGEIAGALETLDAVSNGQADVTHTALHYYWSKDPSFIFASSTPFGMNARQHNAWLSEGGGGELINELLADRNIFALPGGNTGGQMAGWFRKEIKSAQDFTGMKMRVGGFAGKVFQTLGAEPVMLPKDGVMTGLEAGSLDAFEWVGPYDDEKFGDKKDGSKTAISKYAPFYYYPGWWKGGMQMHFVISKSKFDALPKTYQAAVRAAAEVANRAMLEKYDAKNPAALKRLAIAGAQLRLFPQEAIEACFKSATDLYTQLSAENPRFKKVADAYFAFRADQYLWWQVAEYSFDNFMIRQRRAHS